MSTVQERIARIPPYKPYDPNEKDSFDDYCAALTRQEGTFFAIYFLAMGIFLASRLGTVVRFGEFVAVSAVASLIWVVVIFVLEFLIERRGRRG